MHRPNCGNPVEEDDLFCGECGYKLGRRPQSMNVAEIFQTKSHEASSNDSQSTQVDENRDKNVESQQSDSTMKHSTKKMLNATNNFKMKHYSNTLQIINKDLNFLNLLHIKIINILIISNKVNSVSRLRQLLKKAKVSLKVHLYH